MKANDLVELEIKHGDEKIALKRSQPQPPVVTAMPMVAPNISPAQAIPAANEAPAITPQSGAEKADDGLVEIKSPIVGTFFITPSPDSDPYVEIGSQVNPQTVVCIVEAMKVMNEIKAETAGTIAEILVENGQAIEFGQVIFKVKPE